MKNNSKTTDTNMPAYVALACLIAFVVVITICLVKQFIWDPLLSKRFEILRPVLSESVRKLSTSFYRPQSTATSSNFSINKSLSDTCVKSTATTLSTNKNFITIPQNLPLNDNQINPINKSLPRRSYGSSSFNSFAYTNYGSEDATDNKMTLSPILHFSCEYNPSTFSIRLNVQNLRNMNSLLTSFNNIITNKSAYIFLRFSLSTTIPSEPYETSLQNYQDFIRFGETFNILSNIRSGDILNYELKFILMLITDKNMYELGDAHYSLKDDQLTHTLYIERILPIIVGKKLKTATSEDND